MDQPMETYMLTCLLVCFAPPYILLRCAMHATVLVNFPTCFQQKDSHLQSVLQRHLVSLRSTNNLHIALITEPSLHLDERFQRRRHVRFAVMRSIPQWHSTVLIYRPDIDTGDADQYVDHSQVSCTSSP